jgi:hypothetical protein
MLRRWAIIVAITFIAGCADSRPTPLYPVAGKVLVNGLPAAGAMVAFHPLNEIHGSGCLPVGTTDDDGTYRLTTYATGDGAPAGEYAVTVIWPDGTPHDCSDEGTLKHDLLKGRYADATARRRTVTVCPGPNDILLTMSADGNNRR